MFELESGSENEWTTQTTDGKTLATTLTTKATEWTAIYGHVLRADVSFPLKNHKTTFHNLLVSLLSPDGFFSSSLISNCILAHCHGESIPSALSL